MTENEEKILNCLKKVGQEISITDLAKSTKISPKNISRYLNQLEKKNLIIKTTSENDKRIKYIELKKGKKTLFFFRFKQKFLFHTRTIIEKNIFKIFEDKIEILKFPLIEYYNYNNSTLYETEEIDENIISALLPNPKPEIRYERFYLFDKMDLKKLKALGYLIHIYSPKEIRNLREKKREKHETYTLIRFIKHSVKLILTGKRIPTPFIYLDYFLLRMNEILTVENTVEIDGNSNRDIRRRDFKLKLKGYKYYEPIYIFDDFKYTNYSKKVATEREEDEEFEEWWSKRDGGKEEKEINNLEAALKPQWMSGFLIFNMDKDGKMYWR